MRSRAVLAACRADGPPAIAAPAVARNDLREQDMLELAVSAADLDGLGLLGRNLAFRQQQAPQGTQIVQNSSTGGDVYRELGQIVGDQLERFGAPPGSFLSGERD